MPAGGVRLSGGPVLSEGEASLLESDVSSVISISDRYLPSDTEDDDGTNDKAKYRLPDPGKTRLHLRTKEPLSPTARPVPRSPRRRPVTPTPRTPQAAQSNATFQSPIWPAFPTRNGSSESVGGGGFADSDYASHSLSRAESIYTLGRASLQGQLAHLTSLKLPDPTSLAKKISSIPTATEAAKALSEAAEQIRIWISKASDVLHSLNAEDDVEWAAAGGKDGIEDVDKATNRFQTLVEVYVDSIDRLQTREDSRDLPRDMLLFNVQQMEAIVGSWQKVKDLLDGVKRQVELAIDWEELWNSLLGEIGQEMDALNRLVFEMEEKRHSGAGSLLSSKDSIDLHELETIVEERPGQGARLYSHRLSLPGNFSTPLAADSPANNDKEDGSLLALFARMQPLRASLDFLPMRLATFKARGNAIFPSACEDLEKRRDQLEQLWKKLEADAESLRRELGEDRWVLVFRNAGRQALKMEESITRSFSKLKEAVESNENQLNAASFMRKVESYDAKKAHYGPAIERVLAIIDRGVKDRLTVNGEILRLQGDMKQRWSQLQAEMRDMDLALEELNNDTLLDKQFRDSVSTVMSSERSVTSSLVDTPGSSPASSVAGGASGNGSRTPTPLALSKTRRASSRIPSSIPRRIPLTQSGEFTTPASSSPLATRSTNRVASRPEPATSSRPRWQISTRAENRDFLPLSALEPSPYAKPSGAKYTNYLRSSSNPTNAPNGRMALNRKTSTPNFLPSSTNSPTPPVPRIPVSQSSNRKSALPVPMTTTQTPPTTRPTLASRKSHSALRSSSQHSAASSDGVHRFSNFHQPMPPLLPPRFTDGNDADTESPAHHHHSQQQQHRQQKSRSGSSLSSGRRSSLLIGSVSTRATGASGTASGMGMGANDLGVGQGGERPRWRP